MMPFLINPPKGAKRKRHRHWGRVAAHERRVNPHAKRSRKTKTRLRAKRAVRRTTKRFSAAQLAAQRKFVAMVRRRAAETRKARSVSASSNSPRRTGGSKMATRRRKRRATSRHRRRRHAVAANPRRRRRTHRIALNPRRVRRRRHARANPRRRRHYRRNPGLAGIGGGFVRTLTRGVVDGFTVSLGRGVTGVVASKIPFGQTTTIGQGAMQLLVGTGLSMAVRKFAKSDRAAAFFLAGAVSKAIGTVLTPMLPASIAPFLGEAGSYPGFALSSWAPAVRALPSSAPALAGMGNAMVYSEGAFDSDGMTN